MIEGWASFLATYGPEMPYGGPCHYTNGGNLQVLMCLARWRAAPRVAELYTAFGHTAVALASAAPASAVLAFDTCLEMGGWDPRSPFHGEVLPRERVGESIASAADDVRRRVELVVGNARGLAAEVLRRGPYGLVFVDGDHTWPAVLSDTMLALLSLESIQGVVVWDDYWPACPEVQAALDAINRRAGDAIRLVDGTRVAYALVDQAVRASMLSAVESLRH